MDPRAGTDAALRVVGHDGVRLLWEVLDQPLPCGPELHAGSRGQYFPNCAPKTLLSLEVPGAESETVVWQALSAPAVPRGLVQQLVLQWGRAALYLPTALPPNVDLKAISADDGAQEGVIARAGGLTLMRSNTLRSAVTLLAQDSTASSALVLLLPFSPRRVPPMLAALLPKPPPPTARVWQQRAAPGVNKTDKDDDRMSGAGDEKTAGLQLLAKGPMTLLLEGAPCALSVYTDNPRLVLLLKPFDGVSVAGWRQLAAAAAILLRLRIPDLPARTRLACPLRSDALRAHASGEAYAPAQDPRGRCGGGVCCRRRRKG